MYPKQFDRRHFLAASAAFASLHAIPAFPFQSQDPAAPRGRTALLSAGEACLNFKWPEMPATVFLQYARNGNRTNYEHIRTARMNALQALTFAECVEAKGRFLDDITNGIWATCEESFWGVPAHLYIQKADLGLPDPRDPIVDLFAAQTAALLATVVYVLGDKLDTVNPLVRERVYFESERRIFNPLLAQNFMWMGLPGGKSRHDLPWIEVPEGTVQPVNNWDAWICWNWLTTVLLVDRDETRRLKSIQKIVTCLDKFIDSYPDDGGCEEGPGYWNVAAGAMFDGLELLHSATNGAIDIYSNPLIPAMAQYMNRVHVADTYYLNPGDASPIIKLDVDKMFRFGTRLKNPDLIDLAVSSIPAQYLPATLPAIFNEAALRAHPPAKARLFRDTWLPDSSMMAARIKADSSEGLYLACVAADNGKSHSHNDTGSIWVHSNGQPVLIDLGQETYQKKSFDAHRYEIPSTQSSFHNLPSFGEVQQGVGPQFRATDIVYTSSDARAALTMQLREAYPAAAKLKSWLRNISLDRQANRITLEDTYSLAGAVPDVTLNLMTCCKVTTAPGKLNLAGTILKYDPAILTATVETVPLDNVELNQNWGKEVYRIRLTASGTKLTNTLRLEIASA